MTKRLRKQIRKGTHPGIDTQKINLKNRPYTCMMYHNKNMVKNIYNDNNVYTWYKKNRDSEYEAHFTVLHYNFNSRVAVMEGYVNKSPIFMVISKDHNDQPHSIKRQAENGNVYSRVNIDVTFPVKCYTFVQKFELVELIDWNTIEYEKYISDKHFIYS